MPANGERHLRFLRALARNPEAARQLGAPPGTVREFGASDTHKKGKGDAARRAAPQDVLDRLAGLNRSNEDYILNRMGWMRPPVRLAEGTDDSVTESAGEQGIQSDPNAEEPVDRAAAGADVEGLSQPVHEPVSPWRHLLGNAADALGSGTAHLLFSDKTLGSQQGGEDADPVLTYYMTSPRTTQTASTLPPKDEQQSPEGSHSMSDRTSTGSGPSPLRYLSDPAGLAQDPLYRRLRATDVFFHHYRFGNGEPLYVPFSDIQSDSITLQNFKKIRGILQRGKPGTYNFNDEQGEFTTGIPEAGYLGRIVPSLTGKLTIGRDKAFMFEGELGSRPDKYKFDPAPDIRSPLAEFSTAFGHEFKGKEFPVYVYGSRRFRASGTNGRRDMTP